MLTARLALRYLAIFALILAALSAGAYAFLAREYAALLAPAMGVPETARAYALAMQRVLLTIVAFDLPLLALFGAVSLLLARASIEPLLQAQEREREFAADAAHALRSPLATIAAVAQAAQGGPAAQTAQAFATIARAAMDASAVVGELLTLARSARREGLAIEPIDLAAVVADTAKEFVPIAHDNGIALEVRTASVIVEGDERRVRELTRNLLSNALRHAKSAVRAEVFADGDAALVVTNDGTPPDAAVRERLFERFFRGDGRGEGSGLGLAIVRWIAQAHGGSVSVRDCPTGDGTQFVVRLPAVDHPN